MVGEGGVLEGKSPEEIAILLSSGALPEMPQETIDALIKIQRRRTRLHRPKRDEAGVLTTSMSVSVGAHPARL